MHALVLTRKATRTFQPMSGAHNNDTAKAQGLVEVLQTVPLCSYRNQTKMMRMLVLAMGSTALSAAVVSNAYYKKQQFYPTVVYLLNSSRSMGVLYLQAFLLVWLLATLAKKIFFGSLRAAEIEHLIEKSWFAVLETFILLAAFHQELSVGFVTMVTALFMFKAFHWLAGDRIDYMERSPVITWKFHLRAVSLLLLLGSIDCLFVRRAWTSLMTRGASVEIVFGLEYAIMNLVAINTLLKYVLHTIDLQSENPWENKTIYLRYVDIVIGFFKLLLYVSYMAFMLYILFIPLHIARRIYITAKGFQRSIQDVISSHQAIRNLNTLYPDATAEDLQSANNVCIICRDEMVQRCKKLPCNHIFHTACLRSWFQRQQTCPTCRMDVLRHSVVSRLMAARRQEQLRQQQQGQGGGAQGQPQGVGPPLMNRPGPPGMPPPPMMFPHMMWPGMMPPQPPHPPQPAQPPNQQQPQQQQQQQQGEQAATQSPASTPPTDQPDSAQQAPPTEAGAVPPTQATPPTTQEVPQGAGQAPPPAGLPQMPPFGLSSGLPPFMPPPFMGAFPMPPFGAMPGTLPGAMPSDEALRSLSDEQLSSLEGMERANVEARIALLRNVQRLLDAAVTQLNQYSAVMAALGPGAGPGFPGFPAPPTGDTPTGSSTPPKPPGLFQSPSNTQVSGAAKPLTETRASFSFSAASLAPSNTTEDGSSSSRDGTTATTSAEEVPKLEPSSTESETEKTMEAGGVLDEVKSKESPTSMGHVDSEIRQRRVHRFYSLPVNSLAEQRTLETIGELERPQASAATSEKEQQPRTADEGADMKFEEVMD